MSKPLIFLDMDGVVVRYGETAPHPEPVRCLNRVLDEAGASVVLASTWRGLVHEGHCSIFGLQFLLRSHGIHANLIGVTPELSVPEKEDRRWQILAWLKEHKDHGPWVVIDDDPGACVSERRFIQTDPMLGLTEDQALLAIAALAR